MNTKHSGIRTLFAKKGPDERSDASQPGRFVTRLGDVKVETKEHGGIVVIDRTMPVDHFAD